ncbi:Hypothetical predicted protein [Octopus vulgaris]|uniref:Uncharacterized protein n=1 Tax=Octopus vulgaris TaxID=6645 RepID=A0AA36BVH1_OCTVU|nr:Hypothetical predicted protein [Octopus vulgaris]
MQCVFAYAALKPLYIYFFHVLQEKKIYFHICKTIHLNPKHADQPKEEKKISLPHPYFIFFHSYLFPLFYSRTDLKKKIFHYRNPSAFSAPFPAGADELVY